MTKFFLFETAISAEGVASLREAFPNARIFHPNAETEL